MRKRWVSLLAAPLLASGCGSSTASTTAPPAAVPTTPWIMTYGGSVPPSGTPSLSYSSPPPFPSGFLPLPSGTPAPTPDPTGSCSPIQFHAGTINSAGVVVGTTSATVTWWNPGGLDLVEYRVTAIGQTLKVGEQRDIGWTVIKPGAGCGYLSAPVTGLDRKSSYVFSVDAVFTKIGEDGTYAKTIARSIPYRTN